MTDAEKQVREVWEHVRYADTALLKDKPHYVIIGGYPETTLFSAYRATAVAAWQAALAFTLERKEHIRLKEEEIDYVRGFTRLPDGTEYPVWQRILAALQAQLTELQKGMKEQSNGK